MRRIFLIAGLALAADSARADLSVRFEEGAPKDRFVMENLGTCPLGAASITVDLTASRGGLFFDVTGAGAGVSVFQPLEIESGGELAGEVRPVADGDTSLTLVLHDLPPGGRVIVTTDLDDSIGRGSTIVADAEVAGAAVAVEAGGERISGYFGADAAAWLELPPCPIS